jgi:hypothetical protein
MSGDASAAPTPRGCLASCDPPPTALSYARPDTTTLARPVHETLRSYGAAVWFDQEPEEDIDPTWLDVGLAETIGSCDAYVMCASDEFVERAGYATQEVAWAVQQHHAGARTRYFLVVARPGTMLPSIVADWPLLEFDGQDDDWLARNLTEHLRVPFGFTPALPPPAGTLARTEPRGLAGDAELAAMRRRVKHVVRFDEIDDASVSALLSGSEDTRHTAEGRALLRKLGDGLDWSGTLADIDGWPEDSFVCDYRWRLACMKAVAGTRWPLSGSLDEPDDIADDVAYMATRPIPVLDWSNMPGWGDNERRLTLRHHAGLLRQLQPLLDRGLIGGLLAVPAATLDAWIDELPNRRRECLDALVAMRLQGLLSWKGEPPTWDRLFRWWSKQEVVSDGPWTRPVPAEVRFALEGNLEDVAAVAAETTWYAAHHGGLAMQSFVLRNAVAPTSIDIWAAGRVAEPEAPGRSGRRLQLGLAADPDGRGPAAIHLWWAGFGPDPSAVTSVERASKPAPEKLRQAIRFSRT